MSARGWSAARVERLKVALETLILSEFHQKTREKCGQKLAKGKTEKGKEKKDADRNSCERDCEKLM